MGWREGMVGSPKTSRRDRAAAATSGSQFLIRALPTVPGSRDPNTQPTWGGEPQGEEGWAPAL